MFQIIFPKSVEDHPQPVEIFFWHLREYDYVIQIDEAINEVQFAEAVLH